MSNFLADLGGDVARAGQFADKNLREFADGFRRDVLIGADIFLNRVDVHPALVGEGAGADVRLAGDAVEVGDFINIPADFRQMPKRCRG